MSADELYRLVADRHSLLGARLDAMQSLIVWATVCVCLLLVGLVVAVVLKYRRDGTFQTETRAILTRVERLLSRVERLLKMAEQHAELNAAQKVRNFTVLTEMQEKLSKDVPEVVKAAAVEGVKVGLRDVKDPGSGTIRLSPAE